ncbi:MAG: glycine cleavage system aminomethyltransferase GcvT [Actinophytocola sp.]|uniref:glycine cleavage system aminomethyltransferase GcvT n=1 Tax=Actinophytocola sp. TaxID=1872138 RepID=UPI001323E5F6|nr:glycine cleavage system aminomethyltransferase GcvT [Actinophytocola sp.]MPZ80932.1 glycine cleavage system aminomethyltransferase GcvT [Actinophytocola sp.]
MSTASPLHDVHTALGATFTDFAGWSMPLRYGSELAEHRAVREAAGLFDLSHMGEIELTGPEAARALDYALVGKLSAVKVGRARYTMICDVDGGVLDDLVVYRIGADHFMVVANASNAAVVAGELLARSEGFTVEVADRSRDCALIAVQGPLAVGVVGKVSDADLPALPYYGSTPTRIGGHDVLLARTGYTGEDGFEVYAEAPHAADVWRTLTEAGGADLLPCGLACRDTLRLEAGMPLYGNELSAQMSPFDAGLGRVVKLDKPADFVGRAALEQRSTTSAPATLVGLTCEGRRAPRHGYPVLDGDTPVGTVTSGALSPTLGHPIAMAYVPPALSEPGTKLAVDVRGKATPVEVVGLPFYKRA